MTTTTPTKIARHPMMAFAAGVFCPGLGLVMTGRIAAAAVVVVAWVCTYVLAPILVIDHAPDLLPKLPSILLASNAAVWFGAAIVAAGLAWKDGARERKLYEHWWILVGWFVVVFVGFSQVRNTLVRSQVLLQPIYDTSLRPTVVEGTLVVVPVRGFDPKDLRVNDLVALPGAGKVLDDKGSRDLGYARVIGVAGNVVEVKEDGAVYVDGFAVVTTPCAATVPHDGHSCAHEKQATPQGAVERDTTATSFARAFPPTSVGPTQVFVLPDDRGRQLPAPAGLVDVKDIAGKAIVAAR